MARRTNDDYYSFRGNKRFGGNIVFCNNCGNKVPDGSNFCSACGSKLSVAVNTPAYEPEEVPVEKKRPAVSFDWSEVKDEPRKKQAREVVSPWGATTGVAETAPAENNTVTEQRSRTMSFIDILKKEREEKALAAEEQAREVTEREETPAEYSAFEEAPSYYVPPMYDDLSAPAATPFDEPKYEAPIFEVSEEANPNVNELNINLEPETEAEVEVETSYDEPTVVLPMDYAGTAEPEYDEVSSKARLDAELAAILEAGAGKPSYESDATIDLFENTPEESFEPEEVKEYENVADEYLAMDDYTAEDPAFEEPKFEEPVVEKPQVEEPVAEEPSFEEPEAEEEPVAEAAAVEEPAFVDYEALMAELAGLGAPAEEAAEEAPVEDAYVDEPAVEEEAEVVEEPVVEEEPSFEEPVAEEPSYEDFAFVEEAPVFDEQVEETVEEPTEEASVEDAYVDEPEAEYEPVVEEEPETVEEPVVEKEPETKEEEIDSLKKRLAELMGEIEPEAEESEFVAELPEDEPEEVSAEEEELGLVDPTPEAETELELPDEPIVIPEIEDFEEVEDTTTDAMSVEDLERDLFGEVADADVEAEATKKIDKFYTLYKKNEEFQKLLDEEYNKLKGDDEVVPTVSAILDEVEPTESVSEAVEKALDAVEEAAPVKVVEDAGNKVEEVATEVVSKSEAVLDDEEEGGKGGTALTIIAVIIAILLVILLAVILVLNFAPDSDIAMQIDSIIETITSYFSGVEVTGNFLL